MLDVVEYPRLSVTVIWMASEPLAVIVILDGDETVVLPTLYVVVLIVAPFFPAGVPEIVIFDLP